MSNYRSWKAEVTTAGGGGRFVSNGLRFEDEESAKNYARDLKKRWTAVNDWRVVPSNDPVTEDSTTAKWAKGGAKRPHKDAPAWRVKL